MENDKNTKEYESNNENELNEREIETEDNDLEVELSSNEESQEIRKPSEFNPDLEATHEEQSSEINYDRENIETLDPQTNIDLINGETDTLDALTSQEIDEVTLKQQIRELHSNLIEGALYAAGRPLDVEELATKLEIPKKEVEILITELAFDYLERSSALIINQVGEKFQMALRPEYVEKVSKFAKGGGIAERYLRTLTVIALKQPILKSTVIKIRGTGAYEHVKYLIDNDLVSAVKKGRSQELTTTDKYADMFGLPKNMQELKRMMITQLGIEESNKE